jgi:hypothetical protein
VVVTLTASETILQPLGRSGPATGTVFTKTFTDNTGYNLTITNLNTFTGTVAVSVANIDIEAPSLVTLTTPITLTSGDVTVTLNAADNKS